MVVEIPNKDRIYYLEKRNLNGFISLDREIMTWRYWNDPYVAHLYTTLILLSNYEDKEEDGFLVKRGSVKITINELNKITGISIQRIRTAIAKMKATKDLTEEEEPKPRIITVVNYDKRQDANRNINKTSNNKSNSTSNSTSNNKTNRSCNNSSYYNNNITTSNMVSSSETTPPKEYSGWGDELE